MWRSAASNALTFLILVFLLIGALALWGQALYFGAGPLSEAKCLLVDRGQTMRKLSQKLDEMGALSQPAIFRIGSEYENKTAQLKGRQFLNSPRVFNARDCRYCNPRWGKYLRY